MNLGSLIEANCLPIAALELFIVLAKLLKIRCFITAKGALDFVLDDSNLLLVLYSCLACLTSRPQFLIIFSLASAL